MALAHVCTGCGHSLTRVRAVLDAEYNLPIVTCPACSRSCVRRRHPSVTRARAIMRLRRSLHHLVAVPVLMAALMAGSMWAAMLSLDLMRALGTDWLSLILDLCTGRIATMKLPAWMVGAGEVYSPLILVFMLTGAGTVAGFALTHWRKPMIALAWLAVWNAVLGVPLVVNGIDRLVFSVFEPTGRSSVSHLSSKYADAAWNLAAASLISLPIFFAGIGIGRVLTRVSARFASRRWNRRRRARRRLRESR